MVSSGLRAPRPGGGSHLLVGVVAHTKAGPLFAGVPTTTETTRSKTWCESLRPSGLLVRPPGLPPGPPAPPPTWRAPLPPNQDGDGSGLEVGDTIRWQEACQPPELPLRAFTRLA